MHIALLAPEIPHNAGAIGRTCAVTGSVLHLINPLGFKLDEKHLRRSGMDYWHSIDVRLYDDYTDFLKRFSGGTVYYATTKAPLSYDSFKFGMDDCFMFGAESSGIPENILKNNLDACLRVPMSAESRSLNLSVSAGVILYEALRQNGFPGLNRPGKFASES